MARIAASCTLSGAGKSGWPMQKLMMSLPVRASAFTSASTTKAFSVPRAAARRLMSGIGVDGRKGWRSARFYRSTIARHADQLRRLRGGPQARRYRQARYPRSEERRVGKEGRSRWARYQTKKKKKKE